MGDSAIRRLALLAGTPEAIPHRTADHFRKGKFFVLCRGEPARALPPGESNLHQNVLAYSHDVAYTFVTRSKQRKRDRVGHEFPRAGGSKVVTDDAAGLVGLLLEFANMSPPLDPATVENHFRRHPWCQRAWWLSITPSVMGTPDPRRVFDDALLEESGEETRDAMAAFTADHAMVRSELRRIARANRPQQAELRELIAERLRRYITVAVQTPAGLRPLPLGEFRISFVRRSLTMSFEPFLTGVLAAITYALALLLDRNRGFASALLECPAPCGRFFRRTERRQVYCSHACVERGTREKNRLRQHRRRHGEES